jgi:hypothetical protein
MDKVIISKKVIKVNNYPCPNTLLGHLLYCHSLPLNLHQQYNLLQPNNL